MQESQNPRGWGNKENKILDTLKKNRGSDNAHAEMVKKMQENIRARMKDHMKQKVMVIDHHDREIWDRISNVPYTSKCLSVGVLFLNLLLPGFGTAIAACNTKYDSVSKAQLVVALFQLLTALVIVGFIFAFYWSILIIKKAFSEDGELAKRRLNESHGGSRAGGYGEGSDFGSPGDGGKSSRGRQPYGGGRDRAQTYQQTGVPQYEMQL